METESTPTNPAPDKGLPPVTPPSSRHIVQMFVVPAVIVGGVVVLGLMCSGAFSHFFGFGQARTAEGFIQRLESPNSDIRWRAANDLVQVLKRDDDLASDPALGFKLAELLTQELDQIAFDEKSLADRSSKLSGPDQLKERAHLKARRDYARFLSSCLATMTLPMGVDVLKQMANLQGNDAKAVAQTRRHAVWMLANLGDNLKRYQGDAAKGYKGLSAERRETVESRLKDEAEHGQGTRRQVAARTLDYLKGKEDMGVIAALAECAKADDPDLRKYTAFALTFWDGSAKEKELAEQTLLALSRDDGHGVRIILDEDD
jgi:hypothetical protein